MNTDEIKIQPKVEGINIVLHRETLDRIMEMGTAIKPVILQDKESIPFMVMPSEMSTVSLECFLPPQRIKQQVKLQEASSFIDYVNRYKTTNSLIFCTLSSSGASFGAVLDYHAAAKDGSKPAYCAHRALFELTHTPEWTTWKNADRNQMNQVSFATWLEDNLSLITEPAGADLLELVRNLHGHQNARFNQSIRLDNGAFKVEYDEDVEIKGSTSTKNGSMELPKEIVAGIAVFQGGEAYRVRARFKTRVQNRALVLYFETIDLNKIIRDSILNIAKQIADKTGIVPLLGQVL